jgi:hypothetical protein
MFTVPCVYFIFKSFLYARNRYSESGGKPDLGYPKNHPVQKFVTPQLSYWDRFRIWVASIIHDLLIDPTIEKEGLNYLDAVFRNPKTQEAGLSLLTQVLQDPRFMAEAQVFGTDLIAWVLA